jgi:predicted RNA-binding protein YlqC (UPF0109 family)
MTQAQDGFSVPLEDGDINRLEASEEELDDLAGNRVRGGRAVAVLEHCARSIASEPDAVVVEVREGNQPSQLKLSLHVAPEDTGRIIGRGGRVAQALRTLVHAAGSLDGEKVFMEIEDS